MQMRIIKDNYVLKLLIIATLTGLLYGCQKRDPFQPKATEESADVVFGWYKFIERVQFRATTQPVVLLNHRNFGFIGVGLYESVRPGIKGAVSFSSKLYQMPTMPSTQVGRDYLWNASANAALASMFKQFLTGLTDAHKASIDSMENANNNRFKLSISDDVLTRSQAFGRSIATAIYNWSTTDNFNFSSVGYIFPPATPSSYVLTPPNFASPVGPFLKDSRPFMVYSLNAIAPPPAVPYSEAYSSQFFAEAKEVYDIGKILTTGQKAIADWWADVGGPGVGLSAPYHQFSIITWVLENRRVKLAQAAEMYAKAGIVVKDGPFIVWRAKYQYNLLRPITYIQRHIDASFQSYLITPPYPEYLSGIVSVYAPALQVLIREFGDIPVTDNAYGWRGSAPRQYSSLSQLIQEVADSRIYAGIHYRFTQNATVKLGKELGNIIADINLSESAKH
ncbi:MAG: vanadium-dependent haloperoxidase [Chitinophagaceae bacterium]